VRLLTTLSLQDRFVLKGEKSVTMAPTPGSAFGPGGVGNVRISYAASLERLHQTLERIGKIME